MARHSVQSTEPHLVAFARRRLERLARLAQEEEETPPHAAAVQLCLTYLADMARQGFPPVSASLPHMAAGEDGNVRCEWRDEDRAVLVFFLPELRVRLVELNCETTARDDVTAADVAEAIGRIGPGPSYAR
jgi:hypothetical protein